MSTKATRRFRSGKKVSQLWFAPADYELVKRAAAVDRRSIATFAIMSTLKAAKDVIRTAGGNCETA
jgi:uncharacterized protein (DUF1778 family)